MLFRYLILFLSILYGATVQETTMTVETTTTPSEATVPFETANDTVMTSTKLPEVTCSNETQWTCRSRMCIHLNQKCDGMIDCADASDEYLDLCKDLEPRPLFGLVLQCSSSCSHPYHDQLCPQICCNEPQYCYYALVAENKEANTCHLPLYPEHGNFSIQPLTESTDSGNPNFWLNYMCDEPYVLVDADRVECHNGKWINNEVPPYCSEACPLNRNSSFNYMCLKSNDKTVACGKYVAVNTSMNVTRNNPDEDPAGTPVSLPVFCKSDKTFKLSTDCVDEIDKMQKEFEGPTMEKMTKYETQFNGFKTNETGSDFETLVNEFHIFEKYVKANLTMMHIKAEQCDITLDLLIWDLSEKRRERVGRNETEV